jgi:protein-L-isoaspartate(D-aspartate) O-methyltransferase
MIGHSSIYSIRNGFAKMFRRNRSFKEEREKAVEKLVDTGYLRSREVIRAMKMVPREEFLPESLRKQAYVDTPLSIGYGQTISALHMVAMMADALNLETGQKILEVGCGSGYHAAVIAEVVAPKSEGRQGHVYSIEIVPELVHFARENLLRAGYEKRVSAILGDGSLGYVENSPYDKILVAAASPSIPSPLIEQLKEGGILVIPVGRLYFFQELLRVRKEGERIVREGLGGVAFVPLRGKHGWKTTR